MNDITALMATMKAAAEKASNGEWVKESGDGWEAACSTNDQVNGGFIIAHFEGPDAAANLRRINGDINVHQYYEVTSNHLSQMLPGTCAFLHSAFDLLGGEAWL